MEKKIYAALDANINRAVEGLRVCEDVFRFVVNNENISKKLKKIRHDITGSLQFIDQHLLLNGRDVENDSLKFIDLAGELSRDSLYELVKSNLHRAIEASRSIEEFIKLLNLDEKKNSFQVIRFSLYTLEKELFSVLEKSQKIEKFTNSLYAILDSSFIKNDEYAETVVNFIDGGAKIIQLRMKQESHKKTLSVAREISKICKEREVVFIVNDYPEIAYLSEADGIHLGADDLPVEEARRILPYNMLIGISTHSMEDAIQAIKQKPDYIAIGPAFDTKSKNGDLIKGLDKDIIKNVTEEVKIPTVCIGGLNPERVASLKNINCSCFAVISYLYKDGCIEENCKKIIESIGKE
ncbi:MAG: thiamine phosphate synthase [Spirochaetota bacterium]|nr:thiamine phosphate synthase [Spirochaetota bacterium]